MKTLNRFIESVGIIDCAHGIYQGQVLAERVQPEWFTSEDGQDQREILPAGPEHVHYWHVLEELEEEGKIVYKDGDLFFKLTP